MQTFLPYQSFASCAHVLDRGRLGKQRVECLQLLHTLTGRTTGWRNHPATLMWADHLPQLLGYGLAITTEWRARGYEDTVHPQLLTIAEQLGVEPDATAPGWVTPELCMSHMSNLIRKLPEHYRPIFGPNVPENLPYVWPTTPAPQDRITALLAYRRRVRAWQQYVADHYVQALAQPGPCPDIASIRPLPFRTWWNAQQQQEAA